MKSRITNNKITPNPLVSVIIPSYNHEKYISQCIESIANQTYKNFELTVIDDGSTDNSRAILENLRSKYNFNLVFQENHGIANTLNRGLLEFGKGKYIAFCASDDYWSLDKIEKQVVFMENNRFYPMCYGKSHYVDEKSKLLNQDENNKCLKGGWIFNEILLFKIHPPVNYMFRASVFDEVGCFNEDVLAEDYLINLLISSKYCIGFIDEYLSYYRYTEMNSKAIRFEKIANSHLMVIESFKEHQFYKKAKQMVYLRKFEMFSPYSELKFSALLNMQKSIKLFYKMQFIKSCIKLIILWK